MLENPTDKILLLSHDPSDVGFLAEIAVTQRALLELALNESDLIEKLAISKKDGNLAAVFVDVSSPAMLRKFEFELQSKLGSGQALEATPLIHFISGEPLALNREVMQSPYFSFYSERKPYDFNTSVRHYEIAYADVSEFFISQALSFDQASKAQFIEWLKKEFLSKGVSIEWSLRFLKELDDVLDALFPARFECSISFEDGNLRVAFASRGGVDREKFRADLILDYGVSVMISSKGMVLIVPVFQNAEEAKKTFRFYKVGK